MRKKLLPLLLLLLGLAANAQQPTPAEWRAGEIVNRSQINDQNLDDYFCALPISDDIFARIWQKSFKADCTTPREDLRYLRVLHANKDGLPQRGELICNKAIAADLLAIFRQLYTAGYRIEKMLLVDNYNADDEASMADNNTSCFNFRRIAGSKTLSYHSRGLAIDINPLTNPCLYPRTGKVSPANGKRFAFNRTNRKKQALRFIDTNDLCYKLFTERGFTWGGSWSSPKDFQHFEKR